MQASQPPTLIPLPWANSGNKNTIPLASQVGIVDGKASLTDGFPPLTFTPLAAGGVSPDGADFNGVLNLITQFLQWQSAGGRIQYDSAFSTSVAGYPKGAVIQASDGRMWRNRVDGNTVAPGGANWVSAIGPQQSGPFTLATSRTLSAAESLGNTVIFFGNTAPLSVTLPGHADCDNGATITFFNASGYSVTLLPAGSDTINPATVNLSAITLASGDTLTISMFLTATTWEVLSGSAQLEYAPGFASSLTANGFKKIGKFLIQWGAVSTDSNGNATAAYPVAFPNGSFVVAPTVANSTGNTSASAYGGTQSSVNLKATVGGTPAATNLNYIAIGW